MKNVPFQLRLNPNLNDAVRRYAFENKVNINQTINKLLEKAIPAILLDPNTRDLYRGEK